MSPNGKWLEGLAPNADVADAARQALGDRLAAVVYWLPPAAYCDDLDIEHVHRLRVSTRRAMAAWRLFHTWLLPKRAKKVRKWLRRIRRSAGEARDLDVLMDRLGREFGQDAANAMAYIRRERMAVQPDIVRVADRARKRDRLAREVDRLIQGIESCCNKRACDECAPFRKWSDRQLAELSKKFFRDLPKDDSSPEALHKFRIRDQRSRHGGGEIRKMGWQGKVGRTKERFFRAGAKRASADGD
jgi:CHAD domain-containing protein